MSFFLTLLVSLLAGVSMPAGAKALVPGGLANDGSRHRDLHTATFLTRDPAGFIDGPKTYNYVGHNPWSAFDPHGLASTIPVATAENGYVVPDITTDSAAGLPPLVGNDYTPTGLPTLTELLSNFDLYGAWVDSTSQVVEIPNPLANSHFTGPKEVTREQAEMDNSPESRFGDLFVGLVGLPGEIAAGSFNLITSADITSAPAEYDLLGGGFYLGEERPRGERYASFALVALSYGRGGSFMDDFVRAGTKSRSFAGTAAKPWVSGTGGEASGTLRRFLRQDEFNAIQAAIRNGDESVSLGRYFTPDNISDANVATMQLALPGTRANPIVGFVDVQFLNSGNHPQ